MKQFRNPSSYQNLTQPQLSEYIKLGDELAFAEAIRRYHKTFLFTAYQMLKDLEWAQDVVQDFYVDFWDKKRYLHVKGDFKGYTYMSIRNNCLLLLKRKKNDPVSYRVDEEFLNIAETPIEGASTSRKIDIPKLWKALTDQQRKVVELFILKDLKRKEAADIMGVSDNTAKTHLSNAMKILREQLGVTNTTLFLAIILNLFY
ncbi:RNA polymerase sigma factor [Chitinophaga filiformis]|uniref:Sigma-70 family RNA polymerase sigma factor n=1 Tax=Chitinophaga filiformis TaxID=104663 RepID=A0ABY4HWL6_CHIFI|nr:sigma-70 family RNA polymerase sigma factor [Chitinophaga filiformis]UPK67982.1 sigma-70 family RNA polymerase sigma factor [Chitinophaga filiformis]